MHNLERSNFLLVLFPGSPELLTSLTPWTLKDSMRGLYKFNKKRARINVALLFSSDSIYLGTLWNRPLSYNMFSFCLFEGNVTFCIAHTQLLLPTSYKFYPTKLRFSVAHTSYLLHTHAFLPHIHLISHNYDFPPDVISVAHSYEWYLSHFPYTSQLCNGAPHTP